MPGKGETAWIGYVYAIEYGDEIKIGHTTNLSSRSKASNSAKNTDQRSRKDRFH